MFVRLRVCWWWIISLFWLHDCQICHLFPPFFFNLFLSWVAWPTVWQMCCWMSNQYLLYHIKKNKLSLVGRVIKRQVQPWYNNSVSHVRACPVWHRWSVFPDPLRRYKFIFFVNYPALFLFSPVISAAGLKDVSTSGIQKKYLPKIWDLTPGLKVYWKIIRY